MLAFSEQAFEQLRLADGSVPGVLRFEMFDITNLSAPDAAHVRTMIYKLVDANTLELEIVWQPGGSEKYTLHRIGSEQSSSQHHREVTG